MNDTPDKSQPPSDSKKILRDFLASFLVPTLITKAFVLYFGIMYADNPGEGYGWGLVISISFTVINLTRFAYKYRNFEDL